MRCDYGAAISPRGINGHKTVNNRRPNVLPVDTFINRAASDLQLENVRPVISKIWLKLPPNACFAAGHVIDRNAPKRIGTL
jgi:hypothetical protein